MRSYNCQMRGAPRGEAVTRKKRQSRLVAISSRHDLRAPKSRRKPLQHLQGRRCITR